MNTAGTEDGAGLAQRARDALTRGQIDLAIALARQAVALDPEDPHLARLLGSVWEAAGEPDLARAAYLAAVAVGANPRHPQPWLGLARLDRAQARLETAEHYARCAIEAAPTYAEGYAELARVLLQGGKADEAQAALASGLRWASGDPGLIALRDAALVTTSSEIRDGGNEKVVRDPETS
jgi:Flp pilus assembly protein TadD